MTNRFTFTVTLALASLVGVAFITLQIMNQSSPAAAINPTAYMSTMLWEPSPEEITLALHRAGLDPHSLAAAGVSSNQIATLVENASNYLTQHATDLATADNALAQSRFQVDHLASVIQSGSATENDFTAYTSAQSALASATAARQSAVGNLFNAAAANLTQEQKSSLTTIAANRERDLPLPYLVINRSDAQWVDLRNALANVRISQGLNESPDPAATALLQDIESNSNVANAIAALAANLNAIQTAWNSEVQP